MVKFEAQEGLWKTNIEEGEDLLGDPNFLRHSHTVLQILPDLKTSCCIAIHNWQLANRFWMKLCGTEREWEGESWNQRHQKRVSQFQRELSVEWVSQAAWACGWNFPGAAACVEPHLILAFDVDLAVSCFFLTFFLVGGGGWAVSSYLSILSSQFLPWTSSSSQLFSLLVLPSTKCLFGQASQNCEQDLESLFSPYIHHWIFGHLGRSPVVYTWQAAFLVTRISSLSSSLCCFLFSISSWVSHGLFI